LIDASQVDLAKRPKPPVGEIFRGLRPLPVVCLRISGGPLRGFRSGICGRILLRLTALTCKRPLRAGVNQRNDNADDYELRTITKKKTVRISRLPQGYNNPDSPKPRHVAESAPQQAPADVPASSSCGMRISNFSHLCILQSARHRFSLGGRRQALLINSKNRLGKYALRADEHCFRNHL